MEEVHVVRALQRVFGASPQVVLRGKVRPPESEEKCEITLVYNF